MTATASFLEETGLEVRDLREDSDFAARRVHARDASRQMAGLERLSRAFVEEPSTILQVLVDVAIELCGADSAGISIEKPDRTDESYYQWVAAAGDYAPFFNAMLPRYPSACGLCLERNNVQHFRVTKRFFDILGVEALDVTDGLLLPWQEGETRGTIFVMSHRKREAFDAEDARLMRMLADFAALAMRNKRQQETLLHQAALAAAASMADKLAHKINNPLQSLTNLVYLAEQDPPAADGPALASAMRSDLDRLSQLVRELLAVPTAAYTRYAREVGVHKVQASS